MIISLVNKVRPWKGMSPTNAFLSLCLFPPNLPVNLHWRYKKRIALKEKIAANSVNTSAKSIFSSSMFLLQLLCKLFALCCQKKMYFLVLCYGTEKKTNEVHYTLRNYIVRSENDKPTWNLTVALTFILITFFPLLNCIQPLKCCFGSQILFLAPWGPLVLKIFEFKLG